ncbi:MAG: hypothetical protein HFJ49_03045 [Clostridia bacterium]|jgi:hypothetical protein|nr:hypothetical protein [Clostridia bacterium]
MSKADNKELEKAKEILKTFKTRQKTINYNKISSEDVEAIETVLQALNNSMPKEIIKNLIETIKDKRRELCNDNNLTIKEKNTVDKILVEIHKCLEKSIKNK